MGFDMQQNSNTSARQRPNLKAGQVLLRPPTLNDATLLNIYAGDIRVAQSTHSIPHPLPHDAVDMFIKRAMQPSTIEDIWVMDGTFSGLPSVLGAINLKRMDEPPFHHDQSEVSFWVAPAFWNLGIASHALRALLMNNPQRSRAIFAETFHSAPGSAHVLKNIGFHYLGDAESYCVARKCTLPTWTYIYHFIGPP